MPETVRADAELLERFERGLDLRRPERSHMPARILGHGEITTVFEIFADRRPDGSVAGDSGGDPGDSGGEPGDSGGEPGADPVGSDGFEAAVDAAAYKRMPMFRSRAEATSYEVLHRDYVAILREEAGVDVAESDLVWLGLERASSDVGRHGEPIVLYIVQERFAALTTGHEVIRGMGSADARILLRAVVDETWRVFAFNRRNRGRLEVGFDAQISNWVVVGHAGNGAPRLRYIDTSTPLMRRFGVEQLDPELFLRSAPSFLVWIIRRLMLADVLERYYDVRRVMIDLAANLIKEQRPDLVPVALEVINEFLQERVGPHGTGETPESLGQLEPISAEEVRSYYREDARVWRVYLAFRKIDRLLHRVLRRRYPYLLPGKVTR